MKLLFKYDMRWLKKYLFLAALISFGISVACGGMIRISASELDLPDFLTFASHLGIVLCAIGLTLFSVLPFILMAVRYYKNFYTDEGYLTFTLPVTVSQQVNSKVLMGMVLSVYTFIVLTVDVTILLLIGVGEYILDLEFWRDFAQYVLKPMWQEIGFHSIVWLFLGLLILLASAVFSNLFLYCCISLGTMITKKARVITSVAIYYVGNGLISFITQIFLIFGIPGISYFSEIPEGWGNWTVTLVMLSILLFCCIFCMLLYLFQYWVLDRKLNLA